MRSVCANIGEARSRPVHDILTITLNPALDMNTETDKVIPDVKLRCAEPAVDPGGGGINVARAIQHMGGDASAIVAIGGHNGNRLLELLMEEGIPTMPIPSPAVPPGFLAAASNELAA